MEIIMDNKGFVNGNEKKMCSQLNSAIIEEDLGFIERFTFGDGDR